MLSQIDRTDHRGRALHRTGVTGLAVAALALVTCELPVVLALLGLGGLSAGAAWVRPPAVVELIAVSIAVAAAGLLLAVHLRRRRARTGRPS